MQYDKLWGRGAQRKGSVPQVVCLHSKVAFLKELLSKIRSGMAFGIDRFQSGDQGKVWDGGKRGKGHQIPLWRLGSGRNRDMLSRRLTLGAERVTM
jgi:hypothetical protein